MALNWDLDFLAQVDTYRNNGELDLAIDLVLQRIGDSSASFEDVVLLQELAFEIGSLGLIRRSIEMGSTQGQRDFLLGQGYYYLDEFSRSILIANRSSNFHPELMQRLNVLSRSRLRFLDAELLKRRLLHYRWAEEEISDNERNGKSPLNALRRSITRSTDLVSKGALAEELSIRSDLVRDKLYHYYHLIETKEISSGFNYLGELIELHPYNIPLCAIAVQNSLVLRHVSECKRFYGLIVSDVRSALPNLKWCYAAAKLLEPVMR